MKKAIQLGLFTPMRVGTTAIKVSHLQFADDTIFLGEASLKNALFLKRFLRVLELVSGLRINKDKCQVFSLKADPSLMEDVADILECRCELPPFKYLGIKVGCRHRRIQDWTYVIEKVRDRLCKWSNLKVSLGGRITLVKSVLSTIPTYALSVFRAPVSVIKKIISLMQVFLWGGKMGDRKLIWAKWDSLSVSKSHGGLGVKDLVCFNKSLLGKWAWRAIEGGDSLWLDIVKGMFVGRGGRRGLSGGEMLKPEFKVRGWWGDVLSCLEDCRGNWFMSGLVRKVGNGESTSFWFDHWVGDDVLCEIFPRIFRLSLDKFVSVADVGDWINDRWVWSSGWRRNLRECELSAMQNLVDLLVCRKNTDVGPDSWKWKHAADGVYSVKSGYNTLLERKQVVDGEATKICKMLWCNMAVPKAQAIAWRILFRRIATRDELRRRGILQPASATSCGLCADDEETTNHLFFGCRFAWDLWSCILQWIGVQGAYSIKASENFLHFCSLTIGKTKRKILASIWICTIWVLWKVRNNIVFNGGVWNKVKAFGEIKSFVWSWMTGKEDSFAAQKSFREWWSNPGVF